MTDYNAKCLVPIEAPTDALQYAIDRTAREVADKVLGEIRNKECCVIRMNERQYGEPMTNSIAVHCRIDIDELVRCKDCKHIGIIDEDEGTLYYHCCFWARETDGWGFCHKAERREP